MAPDGSTYRVGRVDVAGTTIYLTNVYAGVSLPLGGTFTVQFLRWLLPSDVGDIISVMDRANGRGRIPYLDNVRESDLMLNDTDTGTIDRCLSEPVEAIQAPRVTALAGTLAVGGSLTLGTIHRYFMVYVHSGLSSNHGNIVEVTPAGGTQTVDLAGIDITNNHISKNIYRETDNNGLWMLWRGLLPTDATTSDDGSNAPQDNDAFLWDDAPFRHYLRFWPRPSADTTVELHYYKIPRFMGHDTDVPEIPGPYHAVLYHLAAARMSPRHGGKDFAKTQTQLAADILLRMEKRYLTKTARRVRKGRWSTLRQAIPEAQFVSEF